MYNKSQNITEASAQEDIMSESNAICSFCGKPSFNRLTIINPETRRLICRNCCDILKSRGVEFPKNRSNNSEGPSKPREKEVSLTVSVISKNPSKLQPLEGGDPHCMHFWNIQSPNGPVSMGECEKCGGTKEFRNSTTYTEWNKPKPEPSGVL